MIKLLMFNAPVKVFVDFLSQELFFLEIFHLFCLVDLVFLVLALST